MPDTHKPPFANPALPVHHALALEAAACAERVLPSFEQAPPDDQRPRAALDSLRAWVAGQAAFGAHAAARAATQPAAVAAAWAAG